MSRAMVARVMCAICGYNDTGIAMAAVPVEDGKHPHLFQVCLECLEEMFDVAKLIQMRIRASERGANGRMRADYGPDWGKVQAAVLERDGRMCQDQNHEELVGADLGDSLVVHHIKPLREFGGDYVAANDPDNLITLCSRCHGRWHGALDRARNQERRQ